MTNVLANDSERGRISQSLSGKRGECQRTQSNIEAIFLPPYTLESGSSLYEPLISITEVNSKNQPWTLHSSTDAAATITREEAVEDDDDDDSDFVDQDFDDPDSDDPDFDIKKPNITLRKRQNKQNNKTKKDYQKKHQINQSVEYNTENAFHNEKGEPKSHKIEDEIEQDETNCQQSIEQFELNDQRSESNDVTTRIRKSSPRIIKRTRKTKRNTAEIQYKNPFVYTNLRSKVKEQTSKPQENSNLKWACMICNQVCADKESLLDHYDFHKVDKEKRENKVMVKHEDSDYFNCGICLKEFTSLRSYEKHNERFHGDKSYVCERCNKSYKSMLQLCVHNFMSHENEKLYRCVVCDFITEVRRSLKQHLQKHEESYKCEICGKGFSSITWFEEHKNFHTGAMPFECEICTKTFPYTRYLVAHKKNSHPEIYSETPVINECPKCKKRFAHKKSLVLHIRGHTGETSVLCDMCGKRLSSSEHLKQHLRIHTGFKPYCCSVCGKGFAKKCNLTLHERVHSGEKPYVCRNCGKCFSQRSTLVIHERYHSGERPYVCHICDKGFVAKGLLSVHLKTCSRFLPD